MTKTLDHEKIDKNEYPYIYNYTEFIHRPSREILGRDKEVKLILATFCRPEISNILLLAEAGVGKTSVVKLARQIDESRVYMEVDLARMLTELNNQNEMASRLKALFDEAERFGKTEGKEMVLFIDEFHQIVQLSSAGVEALKPLLAESGRRGIRVIAATTYEEFNEQVSKNQPLVERFVRINLRQPDKNMTVSILRNIAETYNMQKQFPNDNVFELIYEYTNRYMPSNSQPRKSILLLDALIGWYRSTKAKIDMKLLADVLYDTQGVDVAFKIDATSIEEKINKKVFAQEFAASVLAQRLQLCVADLNDKEKPQSSFLFCGSTGVGKTEVSKVLAGLLFNDSRALIRFDMTEYSQESSLERFREDLTMKVWARPNCIILFDEIEKACGAVTRILLQVLDDGRLSDRNGREVSFINSYIIMTTNAGSEVFKNISNYQSSDFADKSMVDENMALIRRSITETTGANKFPPELLGRIDCIVPFQPLSEKTMNRIVRSRLFELKREVRLKHSVELTLDAKLIDFIVSDNISTDSNAGGARQAIAKLEEEVTTNVAKYINKHPNDRYVGVKVDGVMKNEDKNSRISRATVKVYKIR